mmetsp:Transcript_87940/g.146242  ORF Transcript_87940/g.146242 Transcript_87940/m.146242 type:complete len:280 (-) Transcript_87940:2066-2905(-)
MPFPLSSHQLQALRLGRAKGSLQVAFHQRMGQAKQQRARSAGTGVHGVTLDAVCCGCAGVWLCAIYVDVSCVLRESRETGRVLQSQRACTHVVWRVGVDFLVLELTMLRTLCLVMLNSAGCMCACANVCVCVCVCACVCVCLRAPRGHHIEEGSPRSRSAVGRGFGGGSCKQHCTRIGGQEPHHSQQPPKRQRLASTVVGWSLRSFLRTTSSTICRAALLREGEHTAARRHAGAPLSPARRPTAISQGSFVSRREFATGGRQDGAPEGKGGAGVEATHS